MNHRLESFKSLKRFASVRRAHPRDSDNDDDNKDTSLNASIFGPFMEPDTTPKNAPALPPQTPHDSTLMNPQPPVGQASPSHQQGQAYSMPPHGNGLPFDLLDPVLADYGEDELSSTKVGHTDGESHGSILGYGSPHSTYPAFPPGSSLATGQYADLESHLPDPNKAMDSYEHFEDFYSWGPANTMTPIHSNLPAAPQSKPSTWAQLLEGANAASSELYNPFPALLSQDFYPDLVTPGYGKPTQIPHIPTEMSKGKESPSHANQTSDSRASEEDCDEEENEADINEAEQTHLVQLKQYVTSLSVPCAGCKKEIPPLRSEDVSRMTRKWITNPGKIVCGLSCPGGITKACSTITCPGCKSAIRTRSTSQTAAVPTRTIRVDGKRIIVEHCCEGGRLFALWALSCGWEMAKRPGKSKRRGPFRAVADKLKRAHTGSSDSKSDVSTLPGKHKTPAPGKGAAQFPIYAAPKPPAPGKGDAQFLLAALKAPAPDMEAAQYPISATPKVPAPGKEATQSPISASPKVPAPGKGDAQFPISAAPKPPTIVMAGKKVQLGPPTLIHIAAGSHVLSTGHMKKFLHKEPIPSSPTAKGTGYGSDWAFPRIGRAGYFTLTRKPIDAKEDVIRETHLRLTASLLPAHEQTWLLDASPPVYVNTMLARSPLMDEAASILNNDSIEDISRQCDRKCHFSGLRIMHETDLVRL
jgi:hypothetical protein